MSRKISFAILSLALALYVLSIIYAELWPKYPAELIRVVGSLLSVLGAVGLWLLKVGNDKSQQRSLRKDRQLKLLLALRAEIEMQLEQYIDDFGPKALPEMKRSLLASIEDAEHNNEEHSMPIGVVPKENDVFDRVKDELLDLPEGVVSPVIRYYQADEYIVEMIKAFSSGVFEKKNIKKRKGVLEAYFDMGIRSTLLAFEAIDAISLALAITYPDRYCKSDYLADHRAIQKQLQDIE